MKRHKFLAMLLTLAMTLSLLPVSALAADSVTVTVNTATLQESYNPGDSFVVPVTIAGNTGFTNFDLQTTYDTQRLTFTKASHFPSQEAEDGLDYSGTGICFGTDLASNPDNGKIAMAKTGAGITKNGNLLYLYFTVKDTAKAGSAAISIAVREGGAFENGTNNPVNVSFVPGSVNIAASTESRTVKFMNGAQQVGTNVVVMSGAALKADQIPAAPTDSSNTFLGWFKDVDATTSAAGYVVPMNGSGSGTPVSTTDAITTDTTYYALWAPTTGLQAVIWEDGTAGAQTVHPYSAFAGSTTAAVDSLATMTAAAATMKLYADQTMTLNKGLALITIKQGQTVVLDMNGHTLTATLKNSNEYGGQCAIYNQGTLSIVNSSSTEAKIAGIIDASYACGYSINNIGTMPKLENVTFSMVKGSNGKSSGNYALCSTAAGDIGSIQSCDFTGSDNCVVAYLQGKVDSITNSSFTGAGGLQCGATTGTITNCTFTANTGRATSATAALTISGGAIESITDCTITATGAACGLNASVTSSTETQIKTISNCNITAEADGVVVMGNCNLNLMSNCTITAGGVGVQTTRHYGNTSYESRYPSAMLEGCIVSGAPALLASDGCTLNVNSGWYKGGAATTAEGRVPGIVQYPANQVLNTTATGTGDKADYCTLTDGFTVRFYNRNYVADWGTPTEEPTKLLQCTGYVSGSSASYTAATPTLTQSDDATYQFVGWKTADGTVVSNLSTLLSDTALWAYYIATDRPFCATVGEQQFRSVNAAIKAVQTAGGGTVKLIENVMEDAVIPNSTASVTLDLNGYTLTALNVQAITNNGILTVTDTSTKKTGQVLAGASSNSDSCGIYAGTGSKTTVAGGTIVGAACGTYKSAGLLAKDASSVTISGGTLKTVNNTNWSYGLQMQNYMKNGTLTILGGEITGYYKGVQADYTVVTISGGVIACDEIGDDDKCVHITGSGSTKGSISGGYFKGDVTVAGYEKTNLYPNGEVTTTSLTAGPYAGYNTVADNVAMVTFKNGETELSSATYANGNAVAYTGEQPQNTSGILSSGWTSGSMFYAWDSPLPVANGTQIYVAAYQAVVDAIPDASGSAIVSGTDKIEAGSADVIIDAADANASDTVATVTLPKAVADTAANAPSITITTNVANVAMDSKVLAEIAKAGADVTLQVSDKTKSKADLTPAQQVTIATAAKVIDLNLKSGGNTLLTNGGTFTVTVPFTPPADKTSADYAVFFIDDNGVKTSVSSNFADGSVTFTTNHNSVYAIDSNDVYNFEVRVAQTDFDEGGTITADIYASSSNNATFNSFGFTPSYDADRLTIGMVTSPLGAVTTNEATGKTGYVVNGAGTAVDASGTKIATITFTVKSGITTTKASELTLTGAEMSTSGSTGNATPTVTAAAVNLYASHTISFAAVTNGSLSSTTQLTVRDGTLLSAGGLPTATPSTGYSFAGWTVEGASITTETYTIEKDITLTAVFTPNSYTWSTTLNNAAVENLNGVTDNKVTYGTPVSFEVTPSSSYVLTQVSYAVGGKNAATLQADENGVYTIPGDKILGAISLEVNTLQYHTVTFAAGTGNTLTGATAYVKDGVGGLYTDTTFKTEFSVPEPTAKLGYRLANDDASEPLWIGSNSTNYTRTAIAEETLTVDVTLTAQSIKQWTVSFVADANGGLAEGTQPITVDHGTPVNTLKMPGTVPAAGYVLNEWTQVSAGDTITADTTFTASFKDGEYDITLSGGNAATITNITGAPNNKATHGTAVTFTLTVNTGYRVTGVKYKVGDTDFTLSETTMEAGTSQSFTIPGANITGTIALQLTTNGTFNVNFTDGNNGTVGGTNSFVVDANGTLTQEQLNNVTKIGDSGYTFKEWRVGSASGTVVTEDAILSATVTADITYYAVFGHGTYSVSVNNGVTGITANAAPGTDLTFTPVLSGGLVTGVSAKIGDAPVTVTCNEDGSYTIDGSAIIGNLTLTTTVIKNATIGFIAKDKYMALADNTQLALLDTNKLAGGRYLLSDGSAWYWSEAYKAYVKIVPTGTTAAALAAGLTTDITTETTNVSYTGDINGSSTATPADGGIINDVLHGINNTVTELQRLQMDVTGDKIVSTQDIQWILNTYVGISGQ